VPDGEYTIPFGQANVLREGTDVTCIAISFMVPKALEAAEALASEGIDMEVIDPRTLVPYDRETIANSVRKTGKVFITHQAHERCGYACEITQCLMEDAFDYLDMPPARVCGKNVPLAYAAELELNSIPQTEDLIAAGRSMARGISPQIAG